VIDLFEVDAQADLAIELRELDIFLGADVRNRRITRRLRLAALMMVSWVSRQGGDCSRFSSSRYLFPAVLILAEGLLNAKSRSP
jgi:hypothetical protein